MNTIEARPVERILQPEVDPNTRNWAGDVIYQVYPRSFNEKDRERGEGNLQGVIEKLDYLDELGVSAIWLSPFFKSPMEDGGYDIADYRQVDERFGTLEDFDELVVEAKERNIKIMVDIVANHTSDQHEWFKESASSTDNEKADWYIWMDPKYDDQGNRRPPNNWGSVFSIPNRIAYEKGKLDTEFTEDGEEYIPYKSAWVWNEERQQYYLADFTPEQPNLNWANPQVRDEMKDVLRFWLDRGVEGFRMDVIDHIGKDPQFRDDVLTPDMTLDNPYDQLSRDRSIRDIDTLQMYVADLLSVLDEEAYSEEDIRVVFESHASEEYNAEILDKIHEKAGSFNFAPLYSPWERKAQQDTTEGYLELVGASTPNFVRSNHDVERIASRIGAKAARASGVVTLSLPGIGYIYQGEEGGFPNVTIPEDAVVDTAGLRDGERTPMLWDGSKNAGFSETRPDNLWLPIHDDYKELNLSSQEEDPSSFLSLYKHLLAVRNNSDVLRLGNYVVIPSDNPDVYAFARTYKGERLLTAVNFSENHTTARLRGVGAHVLRPIISAQNLDTRSSIQHADTLQLDGNDAQILTPSA